MARAVLIVDDEPLILEVTVEMLEDLGCDVVTAANAAEALAKLVADQRIEILITDINMPGMSGYELAEKAKQTREGLQLIVLSGQETDGRGFPIIRKPFCRKIYCGRCSAYRVFARNAILAADRRGDRGTPPTDSSR
jgi:two-component system cell cycle response regulator CpdR